MAIGRKAVAKYNQSDQGEAENREQMYRTLAAESLCMLQSVHDDVVRQQFIELAAAWQRLADLDKNR
jgi:hypothetical protein